MPESDAAALVRVQLALECKGVEAGDRLVRIPCAEPDDIPRVYAVEHAGGCESFVRQDVPARVHARLAALPPAELFRNQELVERLLADDAPCSEVHRGASYLFPECFSERDYPDVVRLGPESRALLEQLVPGLGDLARRSSVFAVLVEGRVGSMCVSARENELAAEAWVETRPDLRRRGLARQVTAAWGHDLAGRGKVAFYSHRLENTASAAVARSLGLRRWKHEVAYV